MDKIFILSNGLRIGIIGNIYPAIFDDNTQLIEEHNEISEIYLDCTKFNLTKINNSNISIAFGKIKMSDWVIKEIDLFAQRFNNNEVDILITNLGLARLVLHYLIVNYPNVPLHSPVIVEYENDIPIFKIDSFVAFI